MKVLRHYAGLLAGLLFFSAHVIVVPSLYRHTRPFASEEMQVALPRFVQVLMAMGDRYLAANLAGFRALISSTETMNADNFRIQGVVQRDAAWLNPAHQDNYYIAAAILPWNGEVDAAQDVLQRAVEGRPFDWQPSFYYGFNEMHFHNRPEVGAEWLRRAAGRTTNELEQIQLQQMAALWVGRGEDKQFSINLHRAMARETRHRAFANFLERRAKRLENLLSLDQAIDRFRQSEGRNPLRLQELVDHGVMTSLPQDPFGLDYAVDMRGKAGLSDAGSGQGRRR